MKKRTYIPIILFLPILAVLIAGGSRMDEAFIGTWINADYDSLDPVVAKHVFNADGSYMGYTRTTDSNAIDRGRVSILEKWTDSQGATLYRMEVVVGYGRYYFVGKVDASGETFEQVWATVAGERTLENTIDTSNSMYHIYYRQ
jgi:hypothetical protein